MIIDIHHIILSATEAVGATSTEQSGGVLGTLGINWKSFIAQLVNFSIVLFVFWKWIVKPLGKTLTDRQTKIESGLKNAEYMEDEKKKFEEWKSAEMQKVRQDSEKVLKSASEIAEKIKQETIATAQSQSGKMIEQAKTAIEQEKVQMLREVKSSVAELVVAVSEKILRSKLDGKKDDELIQDALKGLK